MRHGSLFSGIGGFDLAASWMGWENVFHCEKDRFCSDILKHYWPGGDSYGDISQFNATKYRGTIDILSAGFPCQPFSAAGPRKGQEDDRYLWPQTLRIIKEIQPGWCLFENVAGLLTILEPSSLSEMETKTAELFYEDKFHKTASIIHKVQHRVAGTIISDIKAAGYLLPELEDGTPIILCIPACAVNAPHRRDRIWFIAYSDRQGLERREKTEDAQTEGAKSDKHFVGLFDLLNWELWPSQSPFCSGDDGLSPGLDGITFSQFRNNSLKAFGNSIVPQVAFQIFKCIELTEMSATIRTI